MNYAEALAYLLSLGHETLAMKLGLANVERLLAALGHPQRDFPCVQIAGTNGKGSVAAMLDSICRAARISSGLYTSPHLIDITERIRIDGHDIARERFAEVSTQVRAAAEHLADATGARPTFFEQVTASALVAFRDARVSVGILETGLGGRLDATTAARAANAAITSIALDHQEYLGATLAEVAAEKAAIIHPGTVAAVVAPQTPEVEAVIRQRAQACGVEPRFVTEAVEVFGVCEDGRLRVCLRTERDVYENVRLALRGRHQALNASVTVAVAEELSAQGFKFTREQIIEGLETAQHAGRLELVRDGASGLFVLFDGAHNAAGARALRDYLDEFARAPVTLLFGAMSDKPLEELCATLFPAAHRIVLTRPDNVRAAAPTDILRAVPARLDSGTITLAPDARAALEEARRLTPVEGFICVTGSLYLVGEVKAILGS
ncbi:MAG TPA: Mur ligase family protein [Pyrinomonadaceae bacterium]|nr:Mur ligase family protein [Pyrinomonadaceae bacterium]